MHTFAEDYLKDVVENQGKLFCIVAENFPENDTEDFIKTYMTGKTRKCIDEGKAYVSTMSANELLDYFIETEKYCFKPGNSLEGFLPDWIGEFYAYYQWYFNISSAELVKKIPLEFLIRSYPGLHDLELSLAVKKVGEV